MTKTGITGLLSVLASVIMLTVWPLTGYAKKGKDDAKSEVGSELDDRSRHGRGNGDGGSGSSTSGDSSGRSGEKAGYDREGGRGAATVTELRRRRWGGTPGRYNCPALVPDGLEELADTDGIVCLSATKGEAPAAERLSSDSSPMPGVMTGMPKCLRTCSRWRGTAARRWTSGCAMVSSSSIVNCLIRMPVHLAGVGWPPSMASARMVNYHKLTRTNLEKLT